MTTIAKPDAALTAEDVRFDEVIERWFRERLEMQPEWASFLGIHEFDDRLSLGGRDGIAREIAFTKAALAAMDTFAQGSLSPNRELDRDLVRHEANLTLFELTERRSWAGRSDAAEAVGTALFPLFTRDYAPLTERLESIAGRLEAAPKFFAETRERVDNPVRLWTEIDIQSGETLPPFLDTIIEAARTEGAPASTVRRLEQASAGRWPPWTSTRPGCTTTSCRARTPTGSPGLSSSRSWFGCAPWTPPGTRSWPWARRCWPTPMPRGTRCAPRSILG